MMAQGETHMKINVQEASLDAYYLLLSKLPKDQKAVLRLFRKPVRDGTNREIAKELKWEVSTVTGSRVLAWRTKAREGL